MIKKYCFSGVYASSSSLIVAEAVTVSKALTQMIYLPRVVPNALALGMVMRWEVYIP